MAVGEENGALRARGKQRDASSSAAVDGATLDAASPGIGNILSHRQEFEVVELDKSGNVQRRWLQSPDGKITPVLAANKSHSLFFRSMREWRKVILDAFLPVGFPHSVSEDYLAYQTYDSLQAFFSTITSLLANRALLQGLGVGDANSSATFAMLLTILKDAMSRIATIAFAQRFGLRIEPDAKRYRFLADLFNDTAFFLELYSPYFGSLGKVVALSTGEALRALCGVAAGSSKAALSVHFAKHDNLAELNAKEASQETAVGLIGLMVGTVVVKLVEDHRSVVYLMTVLVFAHLWMNYLGVCSVRMSTLNRQRATILFEEHLRSGKVLTPSEVASRENIIFWDPIVRNRSGKVVARLEFAESYSHAMGSLRLGASIAIEDGPMHTLSIYSQGRGRPVRIMILLLDGAEPRHAICAWFAAMEAAWWMDKGQSPTSEKSARPLDKDDSGPRNRATDSELWKAVAAAGWNMETQAFETKAPVRIAARLSPRSE